MAYIALAVALIYVIGGLQRVYIHIRPSISLDMICMLNYIYNFTEEGRVHDLSYTQLSIVYTTNRGVARQIKLVGHRYDKWGKN